MAKLAVRFFVFAYACALVACEGLESLPGDGSPARLAVQTEGSRTGLMAGDELLLTVQALYIDGNPVDEVSVYFLRTASDRIELDGSAESDLITRVTGQGLAGQVEADGVASVKGG